MIAEHKGEVPFVVYLCPFLAGITYTCFCNPYTSLIPVIAFGCVLLLFVAFNLLYNQLGVYKFRWAGGLLLHLMLLLAGIVTVQQHDDRNYQNYYANLKAEKLIVSINNEPALKGKYWHFSANVTQADNKQARGKLLLTIIADSNTVFNYGDELLIPANYKPVDPPFNPAVFNYKAYLANQHIYQQSFLYPGQYKKITVNTGNAIISCSLRLRQRLVQLFKANIKDQNASAVASTLILGYKADLSTDILQAYSKTGTIHVLSVSGAHVAIVFVFISFVLSFLTRYRRGQWIKAVISIVLIWVYAMLTGFSPAVCRSAIMISMVIIGKGGYRNNNTANLLALSAFTLLIYDPLLIADVGFQLSYLAVLGLIMLQPVINKWFDFENKYGRKLWYYISASIAAQVITFPLSAFYFHQFPLYFLISNLFIIIPSELILFSGILAILFSWVPVIGKAIFWVLENTILLMNKGLTLIEHQPFSSIDKIWFTNYDCILLFICVVAFFYFLHNSKFWLLKLSLICLMLVSVSVTVRKINSQRTNSILFYSLNKHPGILFKEGSKGYLLTDLKPDEPNFKYDIQPGIDSNRVDNIQNLPLSADFSSPALQKRSSLIQFMDSRLLIFDEHLAKGLPAAKISVDYLYITGNPHTNVIFLNEHYKYKTLIIDGTNAIQNVKTLTTQAREMNVNYVVLKRNKSFIVASN